MNETTEMIDPYWLKIDSLSKELAAHLATKDLTFDEALTILEHTKNQIKSFKLMPRS